MVQTISDMPPTWSSSAVPTGVVSGPAAGFTCFGVWGLGFEFWGLGFGFGVWGLGFGVEGLGLRVRVEPTGVDASKFTNQFQNL